MTPLLEKHIASLIASDGVLPQGLQIGKDEALRKQLCANCAAWENEPAGILKVLSSPAINLSPPPLIVSSIKLFGSMLWSATGDAINELRRIRPSRYIVNLHNQI